MPRTPPIPQITDAEWTVMKELWKQSPQTAGDIAESLAAAVGWKPSTVKTLLNRLAVKKAVGFVSSGKAYLYRPLVAEADCARVESRSFLNRVFGGSLTPMVAHFIEQDGLSPTQIRELKAILDQAELDQAEKEKKP